MKLITIRMVSVIDDGETVRAGARAIAENTRLHVTVWFQRPSAAEIGAMIIADPPQMSLPQLGA